MGRWPADRCIALLLAIVALGVGVMCFVSLVETGKWSWDAVGGSVWGLAYGLFMGAGVFGFVGPQELRDRSRGK